ILETDSLSANADGAAEPAGTGTTSPDSPSGIVDSFTGSGIQQCREPCSVVIVAARRHPLRGWRADLFCYATTASVRIAATVCRPFPTGLILNQMAYKAGRNTRVSTVPPKVPPIKVYASVPQKTECVRGMNASIAASAVKITGRERCTVASTT